MSLTAKGTAICRAIWPCYDAVMAEGSGVLQIVYERARAANALIILAEADDDRVRQAAPLIERQRLARSLLLDDGYFSKLSRAEQDELVATLVATEVKNAETEDSARKLLSSDTKYLAAALVKIGKADGYVAGNKCATADTIRPALKLIGTTGLASSFFIMLRDENTFFFADCAFNPAPEPEQLARIAVDTARNAQALGIEPRVAFLSFSTAGSATHDSVDRVRAAIAAARLLATDISIAESELQFDAAIDVDVAARKAPGIAVAGHTNVFIFPDLNSGNIAYKIAERLGGTHAIGPLLQGFNAPVNDLSRGCSVQDIVDVVAFTAMQAGALARQ